jgi:hypothetical protein
MYPACSSRFRGNKAERAPVFRMFCRSYKAAIARRKYAAGKEISLFPHILFELALILTLYAWAYPYISCDCPGWAFV